MGLVISQRLAKAMGGEITARMKSEPGSEFEFTLVLERLSADHLSLTSQAFTPNGLTPAGAIDGRVPHDATVSSQVESKIPFETPFAVDPKASLIARQTALNSMDSRQPSLQATPGMTESLQKVRVLIADNDRLQIALLALELMNHHVAYDTAEQGQEALALWREHRHQLIFADWRLPGISGYDLARKLREQEGGNELLIYGLSPDADDWVSAKEAGMDHLLQKPVSAAIISDILTKLVRNNTMKTSKTS